jgi:hypothetical protein
MANEVKYYFLAKTFDFPANSVTLGSIITDLAQPHDTIFTPDKTDMDKEKSCLQTNTTSAQS